MASIFRRGSYCVLILGENYFALFPAFEVVSVSLDKRLFPGVASTMWRFARGFVHRRSHIMSTELNPRKF